MYGICGDDIDDQGTFTQTNINENNNYSYDQLGNLKWDVMEVEPTESFKEAKSFAKSR